MKYTADLREWMEKYEEDTETLLGKMSDLKEMFPQVFGKTVQYGYSGPKPNIEYDTINVGDELYLFAAEGIGDYLKIKVTHKYLTVLFFKWMEGPNKGKEDYMDKGCYMFMKDLYPMIIKILPGWEVDCECNKTKFMEE